MPSFPDIHEQEKIFLQEGWHYEMDDDSKTSRALSTTKCVVLTAILKACFMKKITEELFLTRFTPTTQVGIQSKFQSLATTS